MREKKRKITEEDLKDGITYDKQGRMKYHPEFHPNHGEIFTNEELEYICKFYHVDGARSISFALGRTEGTIKTKIDELKKKGFFEKYRSLNYYV